MGVQQSDAVIVGAGSAASGSDPADDTLRTTRLPLSAIRNSLSAVAPVGADLGGTST